MGLVVVWLVVGVREGSLEGGGLWDRKKRKKEIHYKEGK